MELINRYALDPAVLMDAHDLQQVIRRNGRDIPEKDRKESDDAYKQRLLQVSQCQACRVHKWVWDLEVVSVSCAFMATWTMSACT